MILIIGPNGNIGKHVVNFLQTKQVVFHTTTLEKKDNSDERVFDFLNPDTYKDALKDITKIFFVRPPQIGNPTLFYPFINYCKEIGIKQLVFVSLIGIEKNPIPPHAKIEKYIVKSKINHTFLRPSFFMENLVNPHGKDIRENNEINIPAMKSRTSFIACKDIGEVAGTVLMNTEDHKNKAYSITGPDALNYYEVANLFTEKLGRKIVYTNPSLRKYSKLMIAQGHKADYVKVTKYLYLMTRLGTAKRVTTELSDVLHREATSFEEFITDNLAIWKAE